MPLSTPVKRFAAGDTDIGAARLNELVDKLNLALQLINDLPSSDSPKNRRVIAFKLGKAIDNAMGYYEVQTFSGVFTGTATAPLTVADIGDLATTPDAVGVNLLQIDGAGTALDAGAYYVGMFAGAVGGDDRASNYSGQLIIAFAPGGSLPSPQYQGMDYQGVSQNQGGFDWIHTHAMEST